jgi:RNA polymerase sigma factor (sigma-70 family)
MLFSLPTFVVLYEGKRGFVGMAGIEGSEGLDWRAMRPGLVRFLARRTGCDAAAEDIAQDLWLKVQSVTASASAEIRNPVAYLFRSAANAAFDWRRRQPAPANDAAVGELVADEAASPERQAQGRETAALIAEAIDCLPPKCREAFLLCRVEGLTMREAGRRMGVSERTIENHLAKALARKKSASSRAGSSTAPARKAMSVGPRIRCSRNC